MGFISKHWDLLAERYIRNSQEDCTGGFAYEKYINTPSLFSMFPKKAFNVLDLGCGNGIFTLELAKHFHHVVGIDISNKMLKEVKKIVKGCSFIQHDLEGPFPEFDHKFDLITAKLLLMYIENIDGFVEECYKVMEKNGVVLVSIRHPFRWYLEEGMSYFYEKTLMHNIGGGDGTEVFFIHRTLETYINTFRVNGFYCDLIEEPRVRAPFMIEYPVSEWRDGIPRRLNLRFVKI